MLFTKPGRSSDGGSVCEQFYCEEFGLSVEDEDDCIASRIPSTAR